MPETKQTPLPYRREQPCPFDPVPELLRLGREQPISRQSAPGGDPVWLVTRHADARQVLSDRRFGVALAPQTVLRPRATGRASVAAPARQPGSFLGYDPPEHGRLRRMVAGTFTAKRISALAPRIEEIVANCLDDLQIAGPPADLVATFSMSVPSQVICELLGIPAEDLPLVQGYAKRAFDQTLDQDELADTFTAMRAYIRQLAVRRRTAPDDTVFGKLVRDHGAELTDDELTGMGVLLLVAGQDSTGNTLALSVLLLLSHPEQLAAVRDDPAVRETAVEELLRFLTVAQTGLIRTATEDVVVGGQRIRAGEYVMLSLVCANRDDEVYSHASRFDVTRTAEAHLAFGHGAHYCLGAPLARLEMMIALPALFRRFPDLRLAIPLEDVPFRRFATVYGVDSLPVTWA